MKKTRMKRTYRNQAGQLHREDGPAVEYADGTKHWFINGQRHREDGPAVEYANGDKSWFINGDLHREDGPAVEYASGFKFWYIDDKMLNEEEFIVYQKRQLMKKVLGVA